MLMLIIILGLLILLSFIYFFNKIDLINRELDELYDLYYQIVEYSPKTKNKGNLTVLRRNEVK